MSFLPYQRLSGFVTLNKFLSGQSLREIERRLGYREGRLSQGAAIYRAMELPTVQDFEMYGYSQVAGDRLNDASGRYEHSKAERTFGTKGYDVGKLKGIARSTWTLSGPESIVKVIPVIPHSERETYPPGSGVPQWRLVNPVLFHLVTFVEGPLGKYYRL